MVGFFSHIFSLNSHTFFYNPFSNSFSNNMFISLTAFFYQKNIDITFLFARGRVPLLSFHTPYVLFGKVFPITCKQIYSLCTFYTEPFSFLIPK